MSDDVKKVLVGKENYLFLHNDTNNVIEQITGRLKTGPLFGYRYKILLEMRESYLKSRGVDYYYMVAPNKECVYSELLPDKVELSSLRPVEKIITELKKSSFKNFLYPLEILIEAKKRNIVYSYGDTHWTKYGAFVAYRTLMKLLSENHNVRIIDEREVIFSIAHTQGDLISKLDKMQKDQSLRVDIDNPKSRLAYDNKVVGTGSYQEYSQEDSSLPTALLFRDSFANAMIPFLAESFSKLVVVHQPNIDFTLVDALSPDVVITLQVERFILKVPNDITGMTNKQYAKLKHDRLKNSAKRHNL
ncbi:MAG: hypothetical protein QG567_186 [Campylobacterota bacterium]|nr:hypothetical protein [Campylobacterota bacterium]MDQ1339037.1 hypothetical protein [Campylobacterota bacterium]